MEAKDTMMTGLEHKTYEEGANYPDYKVVIKCESDCPLCAFKAGEEKGKTKGRREVVEWLKEYAIHGGKVPLHTVLHSIGRPGDSQSI